MKQSQNTVVQALHPRSSRMNTVVNYLLATASPVLQAIYSPLHQYYYSAVSAIHQYLRKPAQFVAPQPLLPSHTENIQNIQNNQPFFLVLPKISRLPYSTYLYLDFHMLCSMTKPKEHSREIC